MRSEVIFPLETKTSFASKYFTLTREHLNQGDFKAKLSLG